MNRAEWAWSSRLTMFLYMGVSAGSFYGLFKAGLGSSATDAVSSGALFGLLFGAVMTATVWRRWPGAADLTSRQRRAVVSATRRGRAVADRHLAAAVVEYAAVVRQTEERESRLTWVLFLFLAATLGLAIIETAHADARAAILWWLLVGVWVRVVVRQVHGRERRLAKALSAEAAAKNLLGSCTGTSVTQK